MEKQVVETNIKEITETSISCFLLITIFSVSELFSNLIKATQEKRVKNKKAPFPRGPLS